MTRVVQIGQLLAICFLVVAVAFNAFSIRQLMKRLDVHSERIKMSAERIEMLMQLKQNKPGL